MMRQLRPGCRGLRLALALSAQMWALWALWMRPASAPIEGGPIEGGPTLGGGIERLV